MLAWIDNSHADYVIAAYAVAFIALAGIGVFSVRRYRRLRDALKSLPASQTEHAS